jgi:hypothetical protein
MKQQTLRSSAKDGHHLVYSFLARLNLETCYDKLVENGFETLHSLTKLTEAMLVEIGIDCIGHRLELLDAIENM